MNRDVDFFNTCAENWDSIRNTNPQTLEKLMELADIPANAAVLDVGSGTGVLIPYLHAKVGACGKITAVDFSENMLAKAQEKFSNKLYSKATAFYQDINDYLNFTHQRPFNAYNIDKAQLWGFELENTWQLYEASNIFLNYTNMHTKKEGVHANDKVGLSRELDYRPRHTLALGYQYDDGKWHARYDMTYTSEQKATLGYPATDPSKPYSVQKIGGYVVHNLSATYDLNEKSSVNFSIYNLFDKNYCEVYGYPMEGRAFTATFTQKF